MVRNKWNLNAYIFILKKIFLKGMDQENGYREVRRLITVYCGYNSRLTVYCLHVADVIFKETAFNDSREFVSYSTFKLWCFSPLFFFTRKLFSFLDGKKICQGNHRSIEWFFLREFDLIRDSTRRALEDYFHAIRDLSRSIDKMVIIDWW